MHLAHLKANYANKKAAKNLSTWTTMDKPKFERSKFDKFDKFTTIETKQILTEHILH